MGYPNFKLFCRKFGYRIIMIDSQILNDFSNILVVLKFSLIPLTFTGSINRIWFIEMSLKRKQVEVPSKRYHGDPHHHNVMTNSSRS